MSKIWVYARVSQLPTFFFIFFVWVSPGYGQALQKEKVSAEDYILWSNLYNPKLSADGDWVSYKLDYDAGRSDSLVVRNIKTGAVYEFPTGEGGTFAGKKEHAFYAFTSAEGVGILNLGKGTMRWIANADRYTFNSNGQQIACLIKGSSKGESSLQLIDLYKNDARLFKGAKEYSYNKKGTMLAYISEDESEEKVNVIDTETFMAKEIVAAGKFQHLSWSVQDDKLLFTEELTDKNSKAKYKRLVVYRKGVALQYLDPIDHPDFIKGMEIILWKLSISEDGKKVFFNISSKEDGVLKDDSEVIVEIWEGDDKRTFAERQIQGDGKKGPWLCVWRLEEDRILNIGNEMHPVSVLIGDAQFAISYSLDNYEPDLKQTPLADLYLINLNTGTSQLLVKKQETAIGAIRLSPNGQFISYFNEGKWWNYDIPRNIHYNLSAGIEFPLFDVENEYPGQAPPYGNPGWSTGDKEIFLYDQYDIWIMDNNGSKAKRLTKGREKKITYRLLKSSGKGYRYSPEFDGTEFSREKGLLVQATAEDYSMSYQLLYKSGTMETVGQHNSKLSHIEVGSDGENFLYMEQSYNVPPRLWVREKGEKESILVYESNTQHSNYLSGPVELIHYKSPKGINLEGILYYPDDYQSGKKYPMIVRIYEKQSKNFHHYHNPSQYNADGFNPRNYTSQGYLVLYPDITYTMGNPGISATECVISAVDAVLKKGVVEKENIGLIGQSFGGYETAFIISQTDIFAAAVAGCPATDLTSFYFNMGWNQGKPDMWRFEDQQWRFGFSYYEDPQAYMRNSPLHQAEGINTPVLLWSGRKDVQVAHEQTMEFYLALKRLNKETTLLIYPEEAHGNMNPVNQNDLSIRIHNWFEEHLNNNSIDGTQ